MSSRSLTLPHRSVTALRTLAADAAPAESCGLLVDSGEIEAVPIRNLATGTGGFELDPDETLTVLAAADAAGHGVIGTFHSHPGGVAVPSVHDRAAAVADWWLVITAGGQVRAWWPVPGGFEEGVVHVGTGPI